MSFARWHHESLETGAVKISIGCNGKFSTLGPSQTVHGAWCGAHMYQRPKNSNTVVRVRDSATGKVLEGADRQTGCVCIIVICKMMQSYVVD